MFDFIDEWLRETLTDGITGNFSNMFDEINTKVGDIAGQVGQTPQGWNSAVFDMVRDLSDTVIMRRENPPSKHLIRVIPRYKSRKAFATAAKQAKVNPHGREGKDKWAAAEDSKKLLTPRSWLRDWPPSLRRRP